MATELEKLVLRVEAQTKAARAEMTKLAKDVRSSNNKMQRSFKRTEATMRSMGRAGARLRGQLRTLIPVVTIGGLAAMASSALRAADNIAKTADKVGLTTGQLQELQFAASQSGVNTQTLNMAMQRFSRRMGEAAIGTGEALKTVKQYGVELKNADGTMKSNAELLRIWADRIKGAATDQERLRIAFKLFDSEGAALVNMLRDGRAGLDAFGAQARSLGLIIEDRLLRQAEATRDQFDILGRVIGVQFKKAILEIGPDLQDLAKWLTEAFVNSVKDAKAFIQATREEFELLGDIWAAVVAGIETEGTAIWEVLKNSAKEGAAAIQSGFIGMAGFVLKAVETAVNAIITLINAAIKALMQFATGPIGVVGRAIMTFDKKIGGALLKMRQGLLQTGEISKVQTGWKDLQKDALDAAAAAKKYGDAAKAAGQRIGTGYGRSMEVFRGRRTDRYQGRQADQMRTTFGLPFQPTRQGTTKPPPGGGGSGGRGAKTDAVKKHDEALKKLNLTLDQQKAKLDLEMQTLGMGSAQRTALMETQRQVQALQRQGITLSDKEIAQLRQKNLALAQYKEQVGQAKQALEQIRQTIVSGVQQGFDSVIDSLFEGKNAMESFQNAVKNLGKQLLKLFFRLAVVNPLLNALGLGGKGGLPTIWSIFGGGKETGGPVNPNKAYMVGEDGPEMYVPGRSGKIIPNDKLSGRQASSGPTIIADLRGADVAAVARLERAVAILDGNLERRAVHATIAATANGGLANKVLG